MDLLYLLGALDLGVEVGAHAHSAAVELLVEVGEHRLGKGALGKGTNHQGPCTILRALQLDIVGVVLATKNAPGLVQDVVVDGLLVSAQESGCVLCQLNRGMALEVRQLVGLDSRRRHLLLGHTGGNLLGGQGCGGICASSNVHSALDEGSGLKVKTSPDAGGCTEHLGNHTREVNGAKGTHLCLVLAKSGLLGGALGLQVPGLGSQDLSLLCLHHANLILVLGLKQGHHLIASLHGSCIRRGEQLKESLDLGGVGLRVGHLLEKLDEDAVEQRGHNRVGSVLVRERKLGTQRHGAAVVDLLHHLLHRGDLGNNGSNGAHCLQDALDEGGICPGERGQSTESLSKAAELANRLPALCTVRSVLCKGLDGEGRSGVEVQVVRRRSEEGVKGDATHLNTHVLGGGGVDVAHDVILALHELLQREASDVGLDHVGIARGSAPADALVDRVHGVGRGACKALQDPAVKGQLVGAREHEVSAVLVAVVTAQSVAVSLERCNKGRVALGLLSSQLGVLVAAVKEVLAHSGCIEELLKQGRLGHSQLGGPEGAHKTRPDVSLGAGKVEVPEVGVHLLLRAVDVNDDLLNQLSVILLVGVLALLALLGGVLALAVGVADDAQIVPGVALVGDVLAEGIPGELGLAGVEVIPDLARGGLDVVPEGHLLGGARCSEGSVGLCSHSGNGFVDRRQGGRAVCLDQGEATRRRHKPLLGLSVGVDDALARDGEDGKLDAIHGGGLLKVIEQVKELALRCSQCICVGHVAE